MKLYLIARADLVPAQQAVQAVHAMREFIREHPEVDRAWYEKSNTLAFLEVADKESLQSLLEKVTYRRIPVSGFWEPDRDDELTAIAIGPQGKGLCRRLRLALSSADACAPNTCTPTIAAKTSTEPNITTGEPFGSPDPSSLRSENSLDSVALVNET
jgi:peptidyl-tRNA hydrolase PTH2